MAFLLRVFSPALESVGLGSIGRVANSITNPLVHAFGTMKNMASSIFGGLGSVASTVGSAALTPFRLASSPLVWIGAGALVIYLITNR